jgi:hypothetical protein
MVANDSGPCRRQSIAECKMGGARNVGSLAQSQKGFSSMACECGCNGTTQGGDFLPGHDQTLRSRLEARVGGVLAMRELVNAMESYVQGRSDTESLASCVRRVFAARR